MQCKNLMGENLDEFDEFLAICQNFTIQSFLPIAAVSLLKIFTHQIFLTPNLSNFSTVKILCCIRFIGTYQCC